MINRFPTLVPIWTCAATSRARWPSPARACSGLGRACNIWFTVAKSDALCLLILADASLFCQILPATSHDANYLNN
jgi:hypothetical protein